MIIVIHAIQVVTREYEMSVLTFNAVTYANKLKDAGMATKLADVQAEEMGNIIDSQLVTQSFLQLTLKAMEDRIILKVGAMMVIQSGLILTVIGLLSKHA